MAASIINIFKYIILNYMFFQMIEKPVKLFIPNDLCCTYFTLVKLN
jgi:hypothetical protein